MKKNVAALAIIPLGLFFFSVVYSYGRLYYLGQNSDPEYAYLFNSLNILNCHTPFHIDHPGTTLQVLGAVVLFLKGKLSSSGIQESVLLHPEDYLHAINRVLNVLICIVGFWAGLKQYQITHKLLPALTLQFTLLCFLTIPITLVRVTPEPLLICAVLLLIIVLAPEIFEKGLSVETRMMRLVLTGCVLGFGIVTKITFLPLLALVFIFDTIRKRLVVLGSSAVSFVILTLPIKSRYADFAVWIKNLATHQGQYGQGPEGMASLGEIVSNLRNLVSNEPLLFVLLIFYISLAFVLRAGKIGQYSDIIDHSWENSDNKSGQNFAVDRKIINIIWIVSAVIFTQIAITTVHPATHYMLPAMVLTGFVNAFLVFLLINVEKRKKNVGYLLVAILLVAFAFNVFRLMDWARQTKNYSAASQELLSKIETSDSSLNVGFYRSSLPTYALAFGNQFSGRLYDRELTRLYPNAVFYEIWSQCFYTFEGVIKINRDIDVFLVGSNENVPHFQGVHIQKIYANEWEGIYKIEKNK